MAVDFEQKLRHLGYELSELEIKNPEIYNGLSGTTHEEKVYTYYLMNGFFDDEAKRLSCGELYWGTLEEKIAAYRRLIEEDKEAIELFDLLYSDPPKYFELIEKLEHENRWGEDIPETYRRLKREEEDRITKTRELEEAREYEESRHKQEINITIPIDIHLQTQSPGQVQGQAPESTQTLYTPEKVQAEIDKTLARLVFHSCIEKVKNEYRLTGDYIPKIIDLLKLFIRQGDISVPTLEGIPDFINTHIKSINGEAIRGAVRQAVFRKKNK